MLNCSRLVGRSVNLLNYCPSLQRGLQTTCATTWTGTAASAADFRRRNRSLVFCRMLSTEVVESEDVGLFRKALKRIGFIGNAKSRLKMYSFVLYESVADKINYLDFFAKFNMPNTFNSWFLVTELHVWMLMLRAMSEGAESGEDGRFIRNSIVEAMWADVNTRAKKLGANNPSGTRAQIEVLSEQFQAALMTYDEGIMSDDKVLAGSLWRRFFEKKCDNYEQLERLVCYVRQQVKILDALDRQDFVFKSKIPWIPLKDISC